MIVQQVALAPLDKAAQHGSVGSSISNTINLGGVRRLYHLLEFDRGAGLLAHKAVRII